MVIFVKKEVNVVDVIIFVINFFFFGFVLCIIVRVVVGRLNIINGNVFVIKVFVVKFILFLSWVKNIFWLFIISLLVLFIYFLNWY